MLILEKLENAETMHAKINEQNILKKLNCFAFTYVWFWLFVSSFLFVIF